MNCTINQRRKEICANIVKISDIIKKDMELVKESFDSHRCNVSIIKRDNYYNKKSLKFRKNGICDIKKEIYYINNSNNYCKKTLCANKKKCLIYLEKS